MALCLITITGNDTNRYKLLTTTNTLGRQYDNNADTIVVTRPASEVNSVCTMLITDKSGTLIDRVIVPDSNLISITSNISQYQRVNIGFCFTTSQGYIKSSEVLTFRFETAQKPTDFIPVQPSQEADVDYLLQHGLTGVSFADNILSFYGSSQQTVAVVDLSEYANVQGDLSVTDDTATDYIKNKNTHFLVNDGADGEHPFITNEVDDLLNYYLKSATYTKDEVDTLIRNLTLFTTQVVDTLPQSGQSASILYLLAKQTSGTNNVYDEYLWRPEISDYELIGSTEVDLSSYYTKTETDTLLSAKQDSLVSGTNIKTINSTSLLGSGDISTKEIFYATYGTTTAAEIIAEINNGKIPVVLRGATLYLLYNYSTGNNSVYFVATTTNYTLNYVYVINSNWNGGSKTFLTSDTIDTSVSASSKDTKVPSSKCLYTNLTNKVDKVTGKGLSENDFTTAYKNKVDDTSTKTLYYVYGKTSANRDFVSTTEEIETALNSTGKVLLSIDYYPTAQSEDTETVVLEREGKGLPFYGTSETDYNTDTFYPSFAEITLPLKAGITYDDENSKYVLSSNIADWLQDNSSVSSSNLPIQWSERFEHIYINTNVGYNTINSYLGSLSYDESLVTPIGTIPNCKSTIATCQLKINGNTVTQYPLLYSVSGEALGSALPTPISGCTGYLLATGMGIPRPVYVSDYTTENQQLFQALGLNVNSAGYQLDFFNIKDDYLTTTSTTLNKSYDCYCNNIVGQALFYVLCTLYPAPYGNKVLKDQYVLPTADASTLGGIKVGNNLTIQDGVLSAVVPAPTITDNTILNQGDKIRGLYINNNIGTVRLNTLLGSLSYSESFYIAPNYAVSSCCHTIISGTKTLNDQTDSLTTNVCYVLSALTLASDTMVQNIASQQGIDISGADGYIISFATYTGLPHIVYVSDYSTPNMNLLNALGLTIEQDNFQAKYVDTIALVSSTTPAKQYPAYFQLSTLDDNFTLLNDLFTKFPSTFNGEYVDKEYVDNLIASINS